MTDTDNQNRMPAISLAAVAGRRRQTIELAADIEKRGFTGIFGPSMGDVMGLCVSVAHATSKVVIGPTVQPIYLQHPAQLANQAAYLHEVSEGRFRMGIGVTHGPVHSRLGVAPGKPLTDTRNYVADMRKVAEAGGSGELPPITLATLRDKMVSLSSEIADGAVWANASRSHMGHSLGLISDEKKAAGFFIGNMIPTVIDDDREAAAARNRATLKGYVTLPNYRNYWKEAGYVEEMEAVERAMETKDSDGIQKAMTDAWLSDCTLYGSVGEVRDGVEAWLDAGVPYPILVPASATGGQFKAFEEVFAAFK